MSGLQRLSNKGGPRCHLDKRRKNSLALPKTAERAETAIRWRRKRSKGPSKSDGSFSFCRLKVVKRRRAVI
jgi:hypothetical protein